MDREKDIRTMSDNAGTKVSFYNRGNHQEDRASNIEFGSQATDIAYKKTSRLMQGVFLVTDSIDDINVLKKELRSESIQLLSLVVECAGTDEMVGEVRIRKSQRKLRALLSTAGITQLIRKEYVAMLHDALADLESEYGDASYPKSLKEVLNESDTLLSNSVSQGQLHKKVLPPTVHKGQGQIEGQGANGAHTQAEQLTPKKHIERRDVILNLIRDKQRVTVKDAQAMVPSVSSKTLQRELLAMVSEGVLKREGERRWSVYMLRTNGNGNGNGVGNGHVNGAAR